MAREDAIRRFAKLQVWMWIAAAYNGGLSPVWADRLTLETVGGATCMAVLVTYLVTRIHHDLLLVADWVARLVFSRR